MESDKDGCLLSAVKMENEPKKPIRLLSPSGGDKIAYNWKDETAFSIGLEIRETIKCALHFFDELVKPLKGKIDNVDIRNYDQVRSLAKKFNKAVIQIQKENRSHFIISSDTVSKELLRQIVTGAYNRAVVDEKALNKHYEAFSSQTYGETSYDRMQMIIDEIKLIASDTFVDLGSGVGQLVVHAAGATQVGKAIGIEIASLPSKFAQTLEIEFKKLMNWFGLQYRPFTIEKGDFMDPKYRNLIIHEATVIFINNYAFKSDLETQIKREFLSELKDGTKIISTKPYVPINKNAITDRQMSDIAAIIDVVEMKPCANPCSWTSAYVPYYLHTVNRAKLEKYFEELKKSSERGSSSNCGSRRSSTPSSKESKSNSRESSVGVKDGTNHVSNPNHAPTDEFCFGPTTRRKWTEYVTELEQQKRRKSRTTTRSGSDRTERPSTSTTESMSVEPTPTISKPEVVVPEHVEINMNTNIPNIPIPISVKVVEKRKSQPPKRTSRSTTPSHAPIIAPIPLDNTDEKIAVDVSISRASSPAKKKPRRTYIRRDKQSSVRGRPRKTDRLVTRDLPQARNKMSNDARDGMELMHQMTCAASSGNFDPVAFLADLSSVQKAGTSEQTNPPPKSSQIVKISASKIIPFPVVPSTSQQTSVPSGKTYPQLDKFIGDLRSLYENFLDGISHENQSIHQYGDAATEISPFKDEHSYKLQREFSTISVDERSSSNLNMMTSKGHSNSDPQQFLDRWNRNLERYKLLRAKYAHLDAEMGELNTEMQHLINEYQHYKGRVDSEIDQMQKQRIQMQQEQQQLLNNVIQSQQLAAISGSQNQSNSTSSILQASQLTPAGLDMVINELTQQVLGNNTTRLNTPLLTQLGLFNQSQSDLATLQALASSVNGVVSMSPALSHQSPLQAAALHSASLQQAQQQLPTPLVQNFLSSLDLCQLNLPPNNSNVISKVPNVALNANLTAASSSAELAANATSIGVNNAATSNTFHVGNFPLLNTESKLLAQKNDLKCLASAALQQNIHQNFAHHSEATHLKTHQSPRDNSTIAAVIAEVAAAGASSSTPKKLAKPRNPRGNTTKKTTPVGKQDDPQKEDEIERQIKDIVAKALEVDSAAKSAEKERKARSAEKRKDKSSSGSQEVTPTQLSSSSNSGGAAQSFHSTPEKLTPLSNNTSSSGCGGITNFVNSATTADLFASAARSAAVQLLALAPGNRLASLAQMDSSENYVNQQTPTSSSHQQQQPFNLVQSPTSFSAAISPGSQQRNNLNLSIGKANTIDSYSAATNCKTPSQIVTPSKDYSSIPLISLNLPPAPIGLPQPSSSLVAIKVENICPRPEP